MKFYLVFLASLTVGVTAADTGVETDDAPPVKSQFSESGVQSELGKIIQLIDKRDYRTAVRILKPLAKSSKENPEIWRLLGIASLKKGDYLGAKIAFEKSLEIDSENSRTLSAQAELFMSIGDRDSARSNLYKLDTICPSGCEDRDRVASLLDLL